MKIKDDRLNLLVRMIAVARALGDPSEPGDPNPEYTRGQAELIVDTLDLSMDPGKEAVMAAIWGRPLAVTVVTRRDGEFGVTV